MLYTPMLSFFGGEMTNGTLHTTGDGSNVDGVWVPGAVSETPIQMIAPQPINSNDLVNLADGEHVKDFVKTWVERLDIFTREGDKDADQIVWKSKVYKVSHVDDREELGLYLKLLIKKVG